MSGLSDILYLSIQFNLTASSSVAETPDGLHKRRAARNAVFLLQKFMKNCIEHMGRIEAAIPRMYCASKRSDLSLIGSAFEAAGFRCVRIRTECEAEHRTKGGDPRRHGMLILDGDRVILEIIRSRKMKCEAAGPTM